VAKVRVAASPIHGRGLVAARDLRKGEEAFRFEGPLVPWDRVTHRGVQVWRDWYVEPAAPGRHINHACAPTCEVTAGLAVRTRGPLTAGEELTIDYASVVLWEPWRMACACSAPACRGQVHAWGKLPEAVRARYPAPLFTWVERGRVPRGLPAWLEQGAAKALERKSLRGPRP
jgi:hypothetical protein